MDYEKKYNEALERMKSWAKGEHPECFSEAQKAAEFIFPELKEKESEDEKIRLEIRNFIWGYPNKLPERDKWLAWFEKQGEKTTDKIEPNPAWSEEDEEILKWLCRIIHSQRMRKEITLKEESELGEWMDKWLNHNPQTKQGKQLDADNVWLQNYLSNVTCLINQIKKRFRIMTREEEIKEQAEKKALEPSRLMHPYAKQYKVMSAYEIGFIEGAVWADRTMIEKACEWLKEQSCCGYIEDTDVNEFIKQFKQAMKGD